MYGENLYLRHSIAYHFESERDFFQVFGIYDNKNVCISWDDVEQWCDILGVKHARSSIEGNTIEMRLSASSTGSRLEREMMLRGGVRCEKC